MSATPHDPAGPESALVNIATELAAVAAKDHGSSGRIAHPIASLPGLRLLIVSMKQGAAWAEHSTPGRITVQPLVGEVRLSWHGQQVILAPGRIAALAGNVPHDVHAETDAAFLLTVARPALD